ncbi:unnamed protein product, partial [Rotaria sp. Silwood1]
MSGVAKVPHSNKFMLSQPITAIKMKNSNKQTNKTSTSLPIRISSSKYVAAQRTKARDIVLCLQRTVDNLLEHLRSTFLYFIQAILDSPSFCQTLHVCIVSFSSQEQLIRKLLELAFKTAKTDRIIIRCNTPEFISHINEQAFLGKEYHLSSVVTEIATKRNKTIKPHEILLLDDDVRNILIAEKFGHKVLEIRDQINLDIFKDFANHVLSE